MSDPNPNTLTEFTGIADPHCHGMEELPIASSERARISELIARGTTTEEDLSSPLFTHLSNGLAYTIGSAVGFLPPSIDTCLAAYLVSNSNNLTSGARAWSKHSHRSIPASSSTDPDEHDQKERRQASEGWWGTPSGPVAKINERALALFWKVMDRVTWKNLHWLPHQVLVYEVRVAEGYGMRWSQDRGDREGDSATGSKDERPWIFRGFVEPMMENGHEVGWRHPSSPAFVT